MLKKDHKQLWNGITKNSFDMFYPINKKLMEPTEGEYFKSIPFRIYQNDQAFIQKNFEPFCETGKKRTLGDLLDSIYKSDSYKSKLILIQGISPSLETSLQWLSENLSYPDNFLHICVK
jgi:autophagy-related protein 5